MSSQHKINQVQIIEADSSEIDRKEDEVLLRVAGAEHYVVVV